MFCLIRQRNANSEAFVKILAHLYVGFLDIIACDEGSQFKNEWDNQLQIIEIEKQHSRVESYNESGLNERDNFYPRQSYHKIKGNSPDLSNDFAL